MSDLIERLKELKGKDSYRAFSERVGVQETTAKSWFGTSVPSIDMAAKVARAYEKSLDWLYGWQDDHIPSEHILSGFAVDPDRYGAPGHRLAPLYEAQASAGNGAVVLSQAVSAFFEVPGEFLPANLGAGRIGVMRAAGDSMEPTIRDGDFIVVRFDIDRIRSDGIYVVSYDGDIRVKRLTVNPGSVTLSSDNERHAAITLPRAEANERLIVHGLVFWTCGPPRPR